MWPNTSPGGVPVTLRHSGFLRNHSEPFRCPNIVVQYINLYVSTILRLLSCPWSHPGLRTPSVHQNTQTHNNRHRNLKRADPTVREQCRHDRDTSPVNNQQWDLDAHIGSYIFYEDLYRSDRITTYVSSLCHRYVTYPRFDRRYPIPSSISLPVSLFTRSVIHHLTTNSLVAVLARLM